MTATITDIRTRKSRVPRITERSMAEAAADVEAKLLTDFCEWVATSGAVDFDDLKLSKTRAAIIRGYMRGEANMKAWQGG